MEKKNYLIDMDGVLVHGRKIIPGADEFIEKLKAKGIKFLVLTNNSIYTTGNMGWILFLILIVQINNLIY